MEAVLVVWTLEILASQAVHCAVCPPEKRTHRDIQNVGKDDKSPEDLTSQVSWRHEKNDAGTNIALDLFLSWHRTGNIDGDDDCAAQDGEYNKHVPAHAGKA